MPRTPARHAGTPRSLTSNKLAWLVLATPFTVSVVVLLIIQR